MKSKWSRGKSKAVSRSKWKGGWKRKGSSSKYSGKSKEVSSSKTTGLYTENGRKVFNAESYSATGARTYNKYGDIVYNPIKYEHAVQGNNMRAAARRVRALNPKARAFTYTANLSGGKKYVGMTQDPETRIGAHHNGRGAKVTQELATKSVSFTPHRSLAAAKKAETTSYYDMKNKVGSDNVRGAGYTARFSKRY